MSTCKHCSKCKSGCDFCSCCGKCQRCDNVRPVAPVVNPPQWVPVPYPVYPEPVYPEPYRVIPWWDSTGVMPLTVGDGVVPLTFDGARHDLVGCGGGLLPGIWSTSTIDGVSS